jgi:ssDNA-specific exonuclease RecJ
MENYYSDLSYIQNDEKHSHQDIMTITGFMDDFAKCAHIIRCARNVFDLNNKTEQIIRRYTVKRKELKKG